MFDTDNDTGRVKGSIKDRLISFLYRKRFKIRLLKNKLIKKETKIRIVYKPKFEIKNYRDLKKLGDKVIEVDVKNEKFDFDKYDYYIIEPIKKKGIAEEEITNVNENKKVVSDVKGIINSTKKDLKRLEINSNYPDVHKENVETEITNINTNVKKLKLELPKLDIETKKLEEFKLPNNKANIKNDYEIINHYEKKVVEKEKNNRVVETIANVSFGKNIGIGVHKNKVNSEPETHNNYKKNIKNIKIYKTSKNEKKNESKKTIKVLNKFDGYKIRQLKRNEEIVKKDVDKAKNIIDKMNKEVDKVTKEVSKITKTTGYSRMIASCLRVATGILTLPFSKFNLFNITLGSALINRGLKDLRKGLDTKTEVKINYKYEDLSSMIKETKDKTKLTELLIMDSLSEIKSIKEYTYLGENNIKDLNNLEDNLNKKLKELDKLNQKLSKQDEKNKIKIKKIKEKSNG